MERYRRSVRFEDSLWLLIPEVILMVSLVVEEAVVEAYSQHLLFPQAFGVSSGEYTLS
jgi:hypothetical protein